MSKMLILDPLGYEINHQPHIRFDPAVHSNLAIRHIHNVKNVYFSPLG